ncbi:MAG: hypothetical protein GF329_19250 [Candidatus Lokiarchaeota archaeon]|nr:hypothetical protein [Candidatus Lokiarchaeota archaeon]
MKHKQTKVIRVNIEKVVIFESSKNKYIFLIPEKILEEKNIEVNSYVQIFLRKNYANTLTDDLKVQVKNSNDIKDFYAEVDLYIQDDIREYFYIDLTSWELVNDRWRKKREEDLEDLVIYDADKFIPFELDIKIIEN